MSKTNVISEELFENEVQEELEFLGWEKANFNRPDFREFIDFNTLNDKIIEINQTSPEIAQNAINEIRKHFENDFLSSNLNGFKILLEGIKIYDKNSDLYLTINLISSNYKENKYEFARQMQFSNGNELRIPDITLFINGLPIAIMELKNSLAVEGLEDAFNQNESLKRHSPNLWMFNAINFVSNRVSSKYGSTNANFKHFYGWNSWDISGSNPIKYLFDRESIIEIIKNYTFYTNEQKPVKYLAAPHQIEAVKNTIKNLKESQDNRGGVIWHTQGSGKSVTMVFLARAIMNNFAKSTILMVTDRNVLDQQLFLRFLNAENYLRNKSVNIGSRKELISELNDKKHFGIYFTTVQKFAEETGVLSNRDDIFMLVDEAHRSQNNLDGEKTLSKVTEEFIVKFGYGRYMRDAFPNAKIIGFTGTPLMKMDKDTRSIFGDFTHIYSMENAVRDGATVPINYEMRRTKISLDNKYTDLMDQLQFDYIKTLDQDDILSDQKVDNLIKNINHSLILENDDIIKAKVIDLIQHFKKRANLLNNKAMIVANSRKAAFKYYKNILALYPEYKDKVILVMTESNKDTDPEMTEAIVKKSDVNNAANEFRKPNSKYKIAIVVDMWLTGFDVPDLDVMYLDKVIKWHNLMQAIARVNRTFEDRETRKTKESGLIVDYIGIWKHLADALIQYSSGTDNKLDINIEDVVKAKEKLEEIFQILDDNYIKGITNFSNLDSKAKYNFVIKKTDELLALSNEERNKFIKIARKANRFFKIAYSSITEEESTICKGIQIINSLILTTSLQRDENLVLTIDAIKRAAEQAINANASQVEILESKISKNINDVARILQTEAEGLINSAPRVAAELFRHSIEALIKETERIRPVFAKKASEKLKKIILRLQENEDIERVIEMLRQLSKEIINENNKELEFEDIQLQAFFEVVADDNYLGYNNNSETLRRIAIDLMDKVKDHVTGQFNTNPKVQSHVLFELKKLLKNKYGYPPDALGGVSGILFDKIKNEIRINPDYFRKDD
ncbi:type I site-specific restriction-modification system, R (restriction) subunit [Spiroplasma sabaudiense Ar-1343]|uniref:Type I restriction enzyme endonuclease subunit n=1 Tax=Spiroplasma sabaudiense Ar-1343 TaxID=1276257 RepID=W6A9K8_9MOLU|nr:HsdR family type I site-specific deoxyribonuclease [Spiroplasma sabaudiense]AHI53828.1 type I site-specific restriction-modification system, R (restriction) subunit [Spiroplasma sabaudiense Ar-1343]